MNLEKLKRLQSQVRIGGKGTPRRKKKVIHQTAAADDKKLQSSLKKLSVNTIPGIEEVNIIKDDLTVIHFKNPKAQASLSANTFAVTGHGETKKIVEMLPEIMPQLGQETVVQLRMFANSMTNNQKSGPVGDLVTANLIGNMDDDDVPRLVNDFDEIAKRDEISKTELKPRMEVPGNVTVSKTEAPNGEKSNSQKNVSNKGVDSNYTNIAASTTSAPILKSSEIVKGEEKLPKELTSNVNKTDSSGASNKEVGLNKELPDKQKNKTNIEKVQVQEKHSKSPTKDKKPTGTPAGEKPDMKQEKNHQKTTLQKPKPERLDEKQISEDSAQPVDKAVKVPDVTKSEETSSSSQLKEIPVGEITTILPPSPSTTNTLLSEIVKNQIPITQSDKPPVDNVKTPEVVKDVPKSPEVVKEGPKATESNNAVIQAVKPKVEEPLAKTKEDSTPKKIEAILQPEQAPVSMRSLETDKNMQIKAVPLPVDSKNQVLSENQQNEAKKEIEPIITSTVDVPKSMEIMKPIAAESSLPIKLPEDKKPPSDDKIQTAVAAATQPQPQTANETISCEKTDKTMAPKVQQKQGSKKDSTKQQTKQSSPPSTKTPTEAKKPEVAAKPKQVPAPKPQPPQTSTSPNPVPKTPQTPKSPTGSIKQEKPVAAPKPKATVTTPPKPQTTAPPTKATTSPAKKKSSSPPGTKKPTMDASANSNTREPVKKSQGEEIKGQPSLEVSKVQEGGEQPVGPSASTKKASSDPSPKAKGESGTKAQGSTDQTATIEKPKKVVEPKNSANKPATKVQGNADQAAKPRPDIASPKPKPAKSPAPKITQSSKPTPQKAPEDPNKKPPQ